jgi:hypothetical protein
MMEGWFMSIDQKNDQFVPMCSYVGRGDRNAGGRIDTGLFLLFLLFLSIL